MRLAAATVVASLAWTACGTEGPAPPAHIEPDRNFSLRAGESAPARDGTLRIGFDGVTADSRCPKGEQCVWAGDVTARVWLQHGSGPREARELHIAPSAVQAVRVLDQDMRLVQIDPYPVSGKPIAKADYVVTLVLSRQSAPRSDR